MSLDVWRNKFFGGGQTRVQTQFHVSRCSAECLTRNLRWESESPWPFMTGLCRTTFLVFTLAAVSGQAADGSSPGQNKKKSGKGSGGSVPGLDVARMVTRSTAGATLKSPLGATRIGAIVMYDRFRTQTIGNAPLPASAAHLQGKPLAQAGGPAFEQLLDQQKLPPRTLGALEFYIDGPAFFPAYMNALATARSSIDVQTYIFDNDDFTVTLADLLKEKSRQIPVRVYMDANGSERSGKITPPGQPQGFRPPKSIHRYLEENSAVQVRRTANPYLVADHTKLHIIDGHTAFLGGINLGREYRYEWHDMMARVQGPVVRELIQLYERRWRGDAWWYKLQRKRPLPQPAATSASTLRLDPHPREFQELRILTTDTRSGRRDVLQATLLAIRCAARRVWIQTPYYSSDQVTHELAAAVKRGVDVRIIVPGENDQKIMEANNAADLKKLLDLGAKVYLWPGMTHLKATVIDDWATFGSANYDTLSLRINVELNLATSDPRTVQALATRVFARDFRTSQRLTSAQAAAMGGPLAEFVGDQL
jgi:cardiolipin synthase